jgi:hypothetical protein
MTFIKYAQNRNIGKPLPSNIDLHVICFLVYIDFICFLAFDLHYAVYYCYLYIDNKEITCFKVNIQRKNTNKTKTNIKVDNTYKST